MKLTNRNLHRDTAYFYVGLIISFSISGIALNHRANWNPKEYVVSSKDINVQVPADAELINEAFVQQLAKDWEMEEDYQSFRVRDKEVRLYFDGAVADFSTTTGQGELEFVRKRPLLNEMTFLHQTTNEGWIWYSDIFGLGMLTLAITGMFIAKGRESFKRRGWKFALVGIVFPLVFLVFLA
ncbi:MAG: PepSY-associated TM helix domain-containing protein [Cyclobacteriaceae bacterium]